MQLRNSRAGYGAIARGLHWTVAMLILFQYVLAERAESATLFQKLGILATHKSVGVTIFALALLRLAWRLTNPRPAPPVGDGALRRGLACSTHAFLYLLIIALPVSGWLMSSAANTPVSYFGVLTLPNAITASELWTERLRLFHASLFWALAAVVALHVIAALYHHFVLRDNVLRRMIVSEEDPP